jgi:AcrR family transcriptional regulator
MISKEENILFAAEKLFAEKGFEGTSTREIAKAANVNISMISYYFGSKEKLYEKLVEYRMSEGQFFSKDIIERTDINEWEKLKKS